MTEILWNDLSRDQFENRVETLLQRKFPNAIAVNGRGGDEGIDVRVDVPDGVVIYQLKHFPEGFGGGWGQTRKTQITRSYRRAEAHAPAEWILVVPAKLTPSERGFVTSLGGRSSAGPRISILDIPGLNLLAAEFPDVVAYFERTVLEDAAATRMQYKALAIDPEAAGELIQDLHAHVDSLDPHWTWDLSRVGDQIVRTLRPKHAGAQSASPVTANFTVSVNQSEPELLERVRRVLGFGASEALTIPPSAIQNLVITAPEALGPHDGTQASLEIVPTPYQGPVRELELQFLLDESGPIRSSYSASVTDFGVAALGASLGVRFPAASIQFLLAHPESKGESALNLALEFTNASPSDLRDTLELLDDLRKPGLARAVADNHTLFSFEGPLLAGPGGFSDDDLGWWKAIADDCLVIEEVTKRRIRIPDEVSQRDRMWARFARLLLEANCVVQPVKGTVRVTLHPDLNEATRSFFTGEHQIQVMTAFEDLKVHVFGREISLGPYVLVGPRVEPELSDATRQQIEAGNTADLEVALRPADGFGFWFMLEKHWPQEAGAISPVPWGLDGVDDPPDIQLSVPVGEPEPMQE